MDELAQKLNSYSIYIEELRRRVYTTVVVFIITFITGFFGARYVLGYIIKLFNFDGVTIATSSPFQYVDLATNIGIFCALIISGPLALYHTHAFLKPALTKKEDRLFFKLLPLGLGLFTLGFGYGLLTMYVAFKLLAVLNNTIGVSNIWDIGRFLSQIVVTAALLGIFFQFPLILTFLIKIRLLDKDFLKLKRRHAIVIIFVFVALLPPTDGISLLMTALPLVAIYELTIFANRKPLPA